MLKSIFIPGFLLFFKLCYGQELGLKYCTALSDDKTLTAPYGAGIFFISNDSAHKVNLLLSINFCYANRAIDKTDLHVSTLRFKYSIGILRVISSSQNIRFKIGPSVSYQTSVGSFDLHYMSAGLVLNLKFQSVFHSPLNFDCFLSPEYLFHVGEYKRPDVRIAGLDFGVSF